MTTPFPRRSIRIQSMGPQITNVTKIYDNGEIYRGQIQNGKRHGSGQMIYSNGVVYHGRWNDDIPIHVQITIYHESFLQMVHDVQNYVLE